jgi:hypothetical protein
MMITLLFAGCADTGGETEETESTLTVRALDLQGDPVEDAQIRVGEMMQGTDATGSAAFEVTQGIWNPQVEAQGYGHGAAEVSVPEGVSIQRTINLISTGEAQTFDASTESDVYDGRVRIGLPANALVDEDGNEFTGMAEAHIAPLNPSSSEDAAMPTPLEGTLEGDSEPTPMESIFMADIELTSQSGEALSLKEGTTATLEFVLPDDLQGDYSTGDQIEAYFFDESEGVWMQEGMGEVGNSTYAAGKLAWTVEVSHFTWWNCDEPWTNKNCVQVNVTEQGTGTSVSGAQVYVDGVSYNGTSTATTGPGGDACANFKLNSTAEVSAVGPSGQRAQVGGAQQISGSSTPATCSGQGSGSCQVVQLQLAPLTCVSGRVVDSSGNALSGVTLTGYYKGANGSRSVTATTGSNGEYCLAVPQQVDVNVVAAYDDSGTFKSASTSVVAGSSAQNCGGGSCTTVSDLTPQANQSGCISGTVIKETNMGTPPVSAGTHVYAFGSAGGDAGGVDIDCSQSPSQWGDLAGQTTTNANGNFCLQAPLGASDLAVVVGKCNNSATEPANCVTQRPVGSVTQTGTCGGGNCTQLQESIFLRDACGEGP